MGVNIGDKGRDKGRKEEKIGLGISIAARPCEGIQSFLRGPLRYR